MKTVVAGLCLFALVPSQASAQPGGPSMAQRSAYLRTLPASICGSGQPPMVSAVQIRRINLAPRNPVINASPLTRTIRNVADAGDLLDEVCIEPEVTIIPFCTFDWLVVYRLTFFSGKKTVLVVSASASGCRFLYQGQRIWQGQRWETSAGFWALLADDLHLPRSKLFPQRKH